MPISGCVHIILERFEAEFVFLPWSVCQEDIKSPPTPSLGALEIFLRWTSCCSTCTSKKKISKAAKWGGRCFDTCVFFSPTLFFFSSYYPSFLCIFCPVGRPTSFLHHVFF